jgi:hypothetical protein
MQEGAAVPKLSDPTHERFAQACAEGYSHRAAHRLAGLTFHPSHVARFARRRDVSGRIAELVAGRQRQDRHAPGAVLARLEAMIARTASCETPAMARAHLQAVLAAYELASAHKRVAANANVPRIPVPERSSSVPNGPFAPVVRHSPSSLFPELEIGKTQCNRTESGAKPGGEKNPAVPGRPSGFQPCSPRSVCHTRSHSPGSPAKGLRGRYPARRPAEPDPGHAGEGREHPFIARRPSICGKEPP